MDMKEYKLRGKEMIDYICKYYQTISERRVFPSIQPGYLAPLLPKEAPMKPDKWEDIMKDVESKIMPGITHWNHPRFFAYFPAGNSFASFLGDMLSDGIGCIGFSWASSPACTELETIVLDWLGKAIDLPPDFLYFTSGSMGGGVIQGSGSECVLVTMLAARTEAIKYLREKTKNFEGDDSNFLTNLVAYTSMEAHSCVEKAAKICLVKLRILQTDKECSLRGATLEEAIRKDMDRQLHPFFVSATLGTTASCGFDNITEIGPICRKLNCCWLHIDAAYAGCSFICPENRYLKAGTEFADSFCTNCNKFLNVCFDCSCLWIKDRYKLIKTFSVEPLYLQHDNADATINYRHWMIPLSRRFRSLKLWFTLRNYGLEQLQHYIRNHIKLAKEFEALVRKDSEFEVTNVVRLGLVAFRVKETDEVNREILSSINKEGRLHMLPCVVNGKYCIRFCVVYAQANSTDIEYAWSVIKKHASQIKSRVMSTQMVAYTVTDLDCRMAYVRLLPSQLYESLSEKQYLKVEDSAILMPTLQSNISITAHKRAGD